MWLRSLIEANEGALGDPAAFMTAVNADLARVIVSESFATAIAGVADENTFEVRYANAGHPALLHYHAATRTAGAVEAESAPLGIFPDEQYAAGTLRLEEGDALLAYTDGMVEVETQMEEGGKSRLLGQEGLRRLLEREAQRGVHRLVDRLYYAVLDACAHVGLTDDAAALAVARVKEGGEDAGAKTGN
jgi:sigma-B regulation protein RsbU (phosphoserine phosphatase)